MIINQKKIVAIAYLYMLIPICIFFLTWLKLWIGVIATGILIYGFYKMMKSNVYSAEEYLKIKLYKIFKSIKSIFDFI